MNKENNKNNANKRVVLSQDILDQISGGVGLNPPTEIKTEHQKPPSAFAEVEKQMKRS